MLKPFLIPPSFEEQEAVFARWYNQAPRLLPLTNHRFIISEPLQAGNPVLSVWGTDTIVYGWNLRHYLLEELPLVGGEPALVEELKDICNREYAANRKIPFLGELIS